MTASTIRTKAELDAAFVAGWSLSPNKLSTGWTLQHGKPGHGGIARPVLSSAANAVVKMDNVKRVGGMFAPYYIRAA